ncbi:uncharacterized protein KIAA1958 isoform X2 [Denticeps clupeoides]|uniref:uncharacterized protein KIAA1958 isoform X2 n=1 Tax=Denticeps clupeoides TaxID=299321 RepID=UPI0010A4CDA0|nr:uncharacterized protein KIAA1958 homolog isoform X2 [Denticeps clupeoides]
MAPKRKYDVKFKLDAVRYAEQHSGEDPKRIRDWRRQKQELLSVPDQHRARLEGGGRKKGKDLSMEDCLHTSSDNLSKLVSWAHSHGTICTLIPSLKHLLTEGSHGNLTALWGCSAGHAYHWPLMSNCTSGQKDRGGYPDADAHLPGPGSGSQGDRFLERAAKGKAHCGRTRDSCDFSNCSEASEADDNGEEYNGNLFDIVCESSATDEDSEPQRASRVPPRKRPPPPQGGSSDEGAGDPLVKKIKEETSEDYYTVAGAEAGHSSAGVSRSRPPSRSSPCRPLPHKPPSPDGDSAGVSPPGNSSPYDPPVAKPARAPLPGAQCRTAGQNGSGSAGALHLAGRPPSDDFATATAFGDLGGGANPDLGMMSAQALSADPKGDPSELEERVDTFREQNEKTIRSTQTALRNFRDFLVSKYPSETREIYCVPCHELDAYLASFFMDARQKDGSEYEPNSLANYQCGLERYLKEQRYEYSITRDREFRCSQEALKQKQLELKFKGKGNKPHKSMKLTFADELILRKKGLLSRFNPEGLLNLVWLNTTKAFGHCTGFHSSVLRWGDVRLLASETGLECLEWTYQDPSSSNARTRRAGTECRIYGTPQTPQTCPVQDYKEYAQRRPQAMLHDDAPFYLSIKPVVNLAALHWYNCQALGKNKLAKMVKTMCEKGNIPGRKTNFSVYQSCSSLSQAQSNQIMLICNNLGQQASPSNYIIAGPFNPS